MEKKEKKVGGRPSKLTEKFIDVAENVINEYILACTDADILFLINQSLEEKERIGETTWKRWKNGNFSTKEHHNREELGKRFMAFIKKALIIEKNNLLKEVRKGKPGWQAKAWILERKFKEYNLRVQSDVRVEATVKQKTEQKAQSLIDEALATLNK